MSEPIYTEEWYAAQLRKAYADLNDAKAYRSDAADTLSAARTQLDEMVARESGLYALVSILEAELRAIRNKRP